MPLGSFYQQTYFAKNNEEVEAVFRTFDISSIEMSLWR